MNASQCLKLSLIFSLCAPILALGSELSTNDFDNKNKEKQLKLREERNSTQKFIWKYAGVGLALTLIAPYCFQVIGQLSTSMCPVAPACPIQPICPMLPECPAQIECPPKPECICSAPNSNGYESYDKVFFSDGEFHERHRKCYRPWEKLPKNTQISIDLINCGKCSRRNARDPLITFINEKDKFASGRTDMDSSTWWTHGQRAGLGYLKPLPEFEDYIKKDMMVAQLLEETQKIFNELCGNEPIICIHEASDKGGRLTNFDHFAQRTKEQCFKENNNNNNKTMLKPSRIARKVALARDKHRKKIK